MPCDKKREVNENNERCRTFAALGRGTIKIREQTTEDRDQMTDKAIRRSEERFARKIAALGGGTIKGESETGRTGDTAMN